MTNSRASSDAPRPAGASLYGLYVLGLGASLVGNLAVRLGGQAGWLPPWAQGLVAVLAAVPLLISLALFWRLLKRDLDEMLQRIVLEGLAFAFVVYVPLAALYVNLRAAGVWTSRLDAADILMVPALLAAIGIVIARRRYS